MNEPNEQQTKKKRRWSIIREARVTSAMIGAIGTIIFIVRIPVLETWLSHHKAASDFAFNLFLILLAPTYWLCHVLGIDPDHVWFLPVMVLVVNTIPCVIAGTLVGYLITVVKKQKL
jgi:hypothetical protein